MNLYKIAIIMVVVWLLIKFKRFISSMQISSNNSSNKQNIKNPKVRMDIQDADYEDVE